jgi:hypothetical protein
MEFLNVGSSFSSEELSNEYHSLYGWVNNLLSMLEDTVALNNRIDTYKRRDIGQYRVTLNNYKGYNYKLSRLQLLILIDSPYSLRPLNIFSACYTNIAKTRALSRLEPLPLYISSIILLKVD